MTHCSRLNGHGHEHCASGCSLQHTRSRCSFLSGCAEQHPPYHCAAAGAGRSQGGGCAARVSSYGAAGVGVCRRGCLPRLCLPTSSTVLPCCHHSYLPGSCMACCSVLLCAAHTDHACPFPHLPRPQGQLRKKDALIDKLLAQLTRAEAKYRARLDAAHSPGGCFLPPEHAAAGLTEIKSA